MCVVDRPVLCVASFLFPSPLANQITLSCSWRRGSYMCQRTTFRSQSPSAMGSGELRLSGFPCRLSRRSCPVFTGTRSVGTSMPALYPRGSFHSYVLYLLFLRVQGSKPSHRECFSFSVYECACQCVWLAEGLFSTVALVKVCMVNSKVDFKSK